MVVRIWGNGLLKCEEVCNAMSGYKYFEAPATFFFRASYSADSCKLWYPPPVLHNEPLT